MGVSGQRTHLIGTSLHQASRKTAAGSQRNAGMRYGKRHEQGIMIAISKTGGCLWRERRFPHGKMPQKTRRKEKREYPGGCIFDFAAGAVRATDAPNRYVPTSRIAENAGGRSTECRDKDTADGERGGCRRTPQAEVNDCDAGTYRQVRPTFPKRADAYDVNGDFHIGRCQKK